MWRSDVLRPRHTLFHIGSDVAPVRWLQNGIDAKFELCHTGTLANWEKRASQEKCGAVKVCCGTTP